MLRNAMISFGTWLLTAAAAHATPPPPGTGFDVDRYEVRLTPDFAGQSLSGSTRITLRSTAGNLRRLSFSPTALRVITASADGLPMTATSSKAALTFDLPQPLARGDSITLEIAYAGRPARGVTFGDRSIHTSYFACDWMICLQDSPGDKAVLALDLRLPRGLRSLAPGRLRSVRPLGREESVHAWREERPYSPYLYAFAAGPFSEARGKADGVKLRYLGQDVSPEDLQRLFAPTGRMARFFQDKAGVTLPGARYAQLLVAGSEAQEAAGFSVLGRKVVDPMLEAPEEDWAIAHELAHQWWGNLVTCKSWSEFWLNEGVTTFLVAAWKEHRWGREAYDREMAVARRRLANAENAGFDVPLTFAGEYPSLGVRRAVQYSKGALFMDALRTEVGETAFWNGLRRFTRKHAGGVVESRDFQTAFEQASGRDLSGLFARWVYAPAPPTPNPTATPLDASAPRS